MTALKFMQLLRKLRACEEARTWAKGKDLHEVWTSCDCADWLLWLAGRMADEPGWPTRKQIVLAACACAETALRYVKPGEDRPRIAIETARAWVRGEASIEDVRLARKNADAADAAADAAAYAAAAAAYAGAYAAAAAAYAAEDATYGAGAYAAASVAAAYAAGAAGYAADAAAYAAACAAEDAAYAAACAAAYAAEDADGAVAYAAEDAARARAKARAECLRLIRRELPEPLLEGGAR